MSEANVMRATAAELSEPGFYFVDLGPGVPVTICQVFLVKPRATPDLFIRVPGEVAKWEPRRYVEMFRPRRVKRINPSLDAFAADRPAFNLRIHRGGTFVLGARVTVWHGDPAALALVEMQANGNPGDLRVWLASDEPPADRLPETPAAAYFAGVNPVCPICGGAHFAAECPSPTGRLPNAQPARPVEHPATPTGTPERGETPATGPEPLPPGARRTGDPADAQGDEWEG